MRPPREADLTTALAHAPTVPLHPRVSRIDLDGHRYVVHRRPAAQAADGVEQRVQEMAAGVQVPGRGPLAEPPLLVRRGPDPVTGADLVTVVCEDLGTRWPEGAAPSVHEVLHERWSTDLAAPLGEAIGHLHGLPVPPDLPRAAGEQPVLFPLTPARWAALPDPVLAIARDVQRSVPAERLEPVRRDCAGGSGGDQEGDVVVHGDFKPDNVLLVPTGADPGGAVRTAPRLIDFERAGRGRCTDDLAALLAGLAALSVQTASRSARGADEVRAAVGHGADRALEFFAEVLQAHGRIHTAPVDRVRLVRSAAARLLARAQSIAAVHGSVTAAAVLCTGLARALLTDPERAATALGRHLAAAA